MRCVKEKQLYYFIGDTTTIMMQVTWVSLTWFEYNTVVTGHQISFLYLLQ